MRKTIVTTAFAALAAVAFAYDARAQGRSPLSVEARASAAVPTGSFADVAGGIGTGYGFGVTGELALTPALGVYAGYSYTGFDLDDREDTLDETGLDAGVRASFGAGGRFTPFLKGGVVYHKLETDLVEGESRLGFEVGGGLDLPLGNVISVTPGISYTQIPGDDDLGETDLSHVRLGVGLRFRL
ncbi:MAG TPA: outer membrane beta-barrel protein [Longimicrobiaceae bacterium]|nr:outer membrane beta-barrel protein [Longimicrobiaceae bacterium]